MSDEPRKLTKEQFTAKAIDLYNRFSNHTDFSFEEFLKEALIEWEKQNSMESENLKKYREKAFKDIINETDKLTTEEERMKLIRADEKTVTQADEMEFNNKKEDI